jgi:hypothetical protein
VIAAVLAAATLLSPVPGAYNPDVTPATISTTICVSGYSSKIRPPTSYTNPLKYTLLAQGHLPGKVSDYQLDHMISLSVGGSPRDLRNLWMEPITQAHRDDALEARWHHRICGGGWGLRYTQRVEARYKRDHG